MAIKVTIGILVLCLFLLVCCSAGGGHGNKKVVPGLPSATTFNVMDFGAKPGKPTESTEAFAKAWRAACEFMGNAQLVIPPGVYILSEMIFQGPCKCHTPIVVLLHGTLRAVSDVSLYPGKGWISFDTINGLIVTGGGTIDGRGQNVWKYNDCKTNPTCARLPASVYMTKVTNARIKSINLSNSMGFHMHITRSYQIRLQRLHIESPENSPNTDGMHISQSNMVKVSRNVIRTGDDCISVGQGSVNVTMTKIMCGPGHGIGIGSLGKLPDEQDVRGVIVKNCTLIGTTNGIRIKTYAGSSPSKASGMVFQDIVMHDVSNPIIVNQNYGSRSSKASMVKVSDIIYQNIRGTTLTPVAVNFMCSSQMPCSNVHLHNINLKFSGTELPVTASCNNARVGYSGLQFPPPCRA